jgi:hypothetical protein
MKCILLVCLPVLILSSCKKDNRDNTINFPVVEAYLVPGTTITVKLYQQKSLTDTAKYGAHLTGLQVYIFDGSTKVQLTEASEGVYTYNDKSFLAAGKTYTLQFNYQSFNVSAKTTMPAKPVNFALQYETIYVLPGSGPNSTIDTLDWLSWSNPDSLNHILVFKNSDGTSSSIGNARNRPSDFELNTERAPVYYLTQQPLNYYGHYQVILLSVNQEYIDLLKSNTFNATSQTLANASTNVTNGYGIFTAMQADTLKLNVYVKQ